MPLPHQQTADVDHKPRACDVLVLVRVTNGGFLVDLVDLQEMIGGLAERAYGSNIDLLSQGGRIERIRPSFGRNGRLNEGSGRNMSGQVAAEGEGPAVMDCK